MGKKINNSLTRKDGNKLGKRKKERKWLELEFKSKMNPLDIKAFAKDIIESTGERRERLYLPSFAGPVSEVLSMDHGIKAGDFASIRVAVVGGGEDNHWKSGTHMQMIMSAMKHDIPLARICLEDDHEEVISRVLDTIKEYERPTLPDVFIHSDDAMLFRLNREMQDQDTNLNNDDHHAVWCGPIIDHDRSIIGSSRNNDEVNNEIFLRARNVGKSIVYPNVLFPVKVEK